MIYTSYTGNIKNIPETYKTISITRDIPEWADKYITEKRLDLAPNEQDYKDFQEDVITEEEFIERYNKILKRIKIKKILKELDNSVLITNTKLGHFCYRHLLSDYLRSKKIRVTEIETRDSLKDISVETIDRLTPSICNKNPDKIYVFGDNLIQKGKKGQSVIRDCPNAFGIPTKRYPTTKHDAYFSDTLQDRAAITIRLFKLRNLAYNGKTIVFPTDGIGAGLAQMGYRSPLIYIFMTNFIDSNFLKFKLSEEDKVRIIVAGSRKIRDYKYVSDYLDNYLPNKKRPVIITGMANGPDKYAYRYAKKNKIEYEEYPAKWDDYGKSAGYRRNLEMAEVSDELIAFWDKKSKGTKHMIDIAKKEKLKVTIVNYT